MSSSSVERHAVTAMDVDVNSDSLRVDLSDGRTITAPLAWFPRLMQATSKERKEWRLIGGGRGIHWPAVDEDISVSGLLAGQPSTESQTSLAKWLATRAKATERPKKSSRNKP
jgi:Protein of unknown function (DUF2442)